MSVYKFSALKNKQHLPFDPEADVLKFDSKSIPATAVTLAVVDGSLKFTYGGKSIFLDGVGLESIGSGSVVFGDGSALVLGDGTTNTLHDYYGQSYDFSSSTAAMQVWGLGGADLITTGSGADLLVGNDAIKPLNHVSRDGSTGSPNSSTSPTVSADGNRVAFAGGWTAFGSTNNNGTDVFVKDMTSGAVSNEHKDGNGNNGNSGSGSPVISADGHWLVFQSSSGLVTDSPPSNTLYMADVNGSSIKAISKTTGDGAYADRAASLPDVSADGRYVVFSSAATNLAAGGNSNFDDVFLKDTTTGVVTRISTSKTGGDGNGESGNLGNAAFSGAKISADGRFVVFQSEASNLTSGDTNGYADIFVWDRETAKLTNITKGLVAVSNPNNGNTRPDVAFDAVSANAADGYYGGYVVFETARNLVAADTSNGTDIYRYNLFTKQVELVSSSATGTVGNLSSGDASISGDGRFVTFTSYANNLVAGDTNGVADVFVKDMVTGAIALVSSSAKGVAGNAASGSAQISLGGDWIVFQSSASNLASTDANGGFSDVFRVSNPLLLDVLSGGAGDDTYVINRADTIVEAPGGGIDTVKSSITYTLAANVENLILTGSANINGKGNALDNVITGNAGNNVLNGAGGIDTVSYAPSTVAVTVDLSLTGAQATGFGSDTLTNFENIIGSALNDKLTGNALANRLDGGLGNDTLTGGEGGDTYVVDSSADIIVETGAAGEIDTVVSAVNWTLGSTLENLTLTGTVATIGQGNSRDNVIIGNALANTLKGYGGNDTLDGGAGNDTLYGGNGSDTYIVDSSADIIVEDGTGAGDVDTVVSAVNWTLGSTLENLTLTGTVATTGQGNSGNNVIIGNSLANTLRGYGGNDTIKGGGGDDTIRGDAGDDVLTGGSGSDTFTLNSLVGSDTITDFASGIDKLLVSQSTLRIGDGDQVVEGAVTRSAPGNFSTAAELVVFTANVASLNTTAAAAAIGSANSAYAVDQQVLFALDTGSSSGLYLFHAHNADAVVEASELTLLATLNGTASTAVGDYVFGP